MTCATPPGWGQQGWGTEPWGGIDPSDSGEPFTTPAFNVYCFGPCAGISNLSLYPDIEFLGSGTAFPLDGPFLNQLVGSGGTYDPTNAQIFINSAVAEAFTFEFALEERSLPTNFSSLTTNHIFVGVADNEGNAAGLFFSKAGLLYTGSVHVVSGTLILDTPLQPLPNSQLLVEEGGRYVVRIASDYTSGVTYVYITKTTDVGLIGQQLRYVLPAIRSEDAIFVPMDGVMISVRGTALEPSVAVFESICLGNGLAIPNLPPRADAGTDQAARMCSVVLLNGSESYDPEGVPLQYLWRLTNAPTGSEFVFDGADGLTYPLSPPTGFTDRFYSVEAGVTNALDAFVAGDVLVLAGKPYVISTTGTDGGGFFFRLTGYNLPDNLSSSQYFKLLRQRALATPTEVKATFYPDVPGLYRFDLTVFDGSLYSEPAVTVVNVVESLLARGNTPDMGFLWGYLADVWKLVEDSDRITTYFSAMSQVVAAELLNLWQAEYSKSLRDIQPTFQRKWLRYPLHLEESPTASDATVSTARFGGLESADIPTGGLGGVAGTTLVLQLATLSGSASITFSGSNPVTAASMQVDLQAQLYRYDTRILVRVITNRLGTAARVRIDAPFAITVEAASNTPAFTDGARNALPAGNGTSAAPRAYRVDRSLQDLAVGEGDLLVLGGEAYRVARVVDDASDPFRFQRITTLDDLPVPAPLAWALAGRTTSPDLDFYDELVSAGDVARYDVRNLTTGDAALLEAPVLGACAAQSGVLPVDLTELGGFLALPDVYGVHLRNVVRKTHIPLDPLIVDIPHLQEKIQSKDDTEVLRRNIDFFLETFRGQSCLRFITAPSPDPDVWDYELPPATLWAETSYLDNRPVVEANFGIPAAFTLDDLALLPRTVDYLSSVRGLWYAHLLGPTLFNIRAGTQILLGLPFAEERGKILEIRNDFSSTSGRILVQDIDNTDIVRSYSYPAVLSLETNPATGAPYIVGDMVTQFAPLVTGVEVLDYVKDPKWFQGYLQQGAFFEVEKYFKFLVRVDSSAFTLSSVLFVQSFVRRIKPRYTFPLFVVLSKVKDTEVSPQDDIGYLVKLRVEDSPRGRSQAFDAPRAGGGGYQNQFDRTDLHSAPPTFPTAQHPVLWGYDRGGRLSPSDSISFRMCTTFDAPTPMPFDSVFSFDRPAYTGEAAVFTLGPYINVPAAPGILSGVFPSVTGFSLTGLSLEIVCEYLSSPATFEARVKKNGSTIHTMSLTVGVADPNIFYDAFTPVAILPGDTLEVDIQASTGLAVSVDWSRVSMVLGEGVPLVYDSTIPAGTYCAYKDV